MKTQIQNLKHKFQQRYKKLKSDYKAYCYYNVDCDESTGGLIKLKDPTFIGWLIKTAYINWKQKHCYHDWEVESHISPDSGSEDFTCKKCGIYHHVIWY